MNDQKLPNATAVLILGILSIALCWCYGFLGLILGIVGLVLSGKDVKLYKENPSLYSNYNNLNVGRVLSIIGIVINILVLAYIIWIVSVIGMDALSDPELLQERVRELQNQ